MCKQDVEWLTGFWVDAIFKLGRSGWGKGLCLYLKHW